MTKEIPFREFLGQQFDGVYDRTITIAKAIENVEEYFDAGGGPTQTEDFPVPKLPDFSGIDIVMPCRCYGNEAHLGHGCPCDCHIPKVKDGESLIATEHNHKWNGFYLKGGCPKCKEMADGNPEPTEEPYTREEINKALDEMERRIDSKASKLVGIIEAEEREWRAELLKVLADHFDSQDIKFLREKFL